jgi:hypothetical protein
MSWNYRIVKYADGSGFGLHEVHYDKKGREISMTENLASFAGDTAEEVRSSLMMAKMDAYKRPVFDEPSERIVYEVIECETWEDGWRGVGLYWTKEQAEAEIDRRKKHERKRSTLTEEEFDQWWNWSISEKTLFGMSR